MEALGRRDPGISTVSDRVNGVGEQIVGRERRARVSHRDWSGDA
jgi:hypothetical protein